MDFQSGKRVSDYRGPGYKDKMSIPTYDFTSTKNKPTFAEATKKYPKNDQGFFCEYKDGLTIEDYLHKMDEEVKAENIVAAYKSSGKIYIYLASKEMNEKFIESNKVLTIKGNDLVVTPLVIQNKKVFFSNVPPNIPHEDLINMLERNRVRRKSPIITLHSSNSAGIFSHVISNRRAVYIHPEDVEKIPPVFKYNFEGSSGIIFMSAENIKCFICKEEGHVAKYCLKEQEATGEITSSKEITDVNHSKAAEAEISTIPISNSEQQLFDRHAKNSDTQAESPNVKSKKNVDTITDCENVMETFTAPILTNKRTHSDVGSDFGDSGPLCVEENKQVYINKKDDMPPPETPAFKRKKSLEIKNLDEQLAPAKEYLESEESKMNFIVLKSFLENNIGGNEDSLQTARRFTEDVGSLCKWLEVDLKPKLSGRGIKSRITRIVKRLKGNELKLPESDEDPWSQDSSTEL